jgi:hypothetical protein
VTRLGGAGAATLAIGLLGGCGTLLGIDPGIPIQDGAADTVAGDAMTRDASHENESAFVEEAASPADASVVESATTGDAESDAKDATNDATNDTTDALVEETDSVSPPPPSSCQITGCGIGEVCAPNGSCCIQNRTACAGYCDIETTDNCGKQIQCSVTDCLGGGVCYQSHCCIRLDPCAGRCGGVIVIDNCGLAVTCSGGCPSGQTCGTNSTCAECTATGAACTSAAACCTGVCESTASDNGACASSCTPQNGSCNALGSSDVCCYPFTCKGLIASPGASNPNIVPVGGTCQ